MSAISKVSPLVDFEEYLEETDDFDLALLIATLQSARDEADALVQLTEELLVAARRVESYRKYNGKRNVSAKDNVKDLQYPTWEELEGELSDPYFRRKYRMTKAQFRLLCDKIKAKVGEDEFRSENKRGLCGYIRVAIGLRFLFGGSYLDLVGRAYGVKSIQSIYTYFHTLVSWVDAAFDFPLVSLLQGLNAGNSEAIDKLHEISAEFAADSDYCFIGCIGAIDGLAIRIICPNGVDDPANYFCRKNFYALNVQAICDRKKRILWISPGHLGSTHDSTAWQETQLSGYFEQIKDKLKEHGFFLVGDSAYPLSVYMQIPYADAPPLSPQDAFNFWLSNSRIHIECTFGELIMRCGLFWRTLRFDDLATCADVIRAAAKIHNFLVDCREDSADIDTYSGNTAASTVQPTTLFGAPEEDPTDVCFPLVTDNNEPKPIGRKSKKRKRDEDDGKLLREKLCLSLAEDNKVRPLRNKMRHNALGHVYFDD
ncbi:hypothetical protein ACHAWF_008022 [Thalassiosira exigua]